MNDVRLGVQNLVERCAEVRSGESVLILNEYGKVEPEIATLIEEAVKATGAERYVLWGESLARDRRDIPRVLLGAFLAADKVIASFALNRAVLDEHTRGRGVVQVNNGCRTSEAMISPHATFHWGMVKAIYAHLEAIFGAGERWRITSPAGTDIAGRIGKGSDVADAYFAAEAEASRFIRVFPGEVYTPVGCLDAEGTIVCEFINIRDTLPWERPATLVVRDSQVVSVSGEDEANQLEAQIAANTERHGQNGRVIDSWHGGMNPRARVPTAENRSLQGATSGSALMHFHVGRINEPISAGILFPTVEVDDHRIYENGALMVLDDPRLAATARALGLEEWPPTP